MHRWEPVGAERGCQEVGRSDSRRMPVGSKRCFFSPGGTHISPLMAKRMNRALRSSGSLISLRVSMLMLTQVLVAAPI